MGRKPNTVHIKKNRIFLILKSRNLSINKLAEAIGYTRQGVSKAIHAEKMDAKTLDDICKFLDVYPGFFTGEYPLRKLKEEYRNGWKYDDDNTISFPDAVSDPSGYDVPKYSYAGNSEFLDQLKNRDNDIKRAYAAVCLEGVFSKKERKTIHPDNQFIEDNKGYLIDNAIRSMKAIINSVLEEDAAYKQWKIDEAIAEEDLQRYEAELPDLWDVFQDEDLSE